MNQNIQKISKTFNSEFDLAKKYYIILFTLNNIHLTKNEINLVAFAAINGTLSTPPIKSQFCTEFNIPQSSLYNMIGKLRKNQILIRDKDNKLRINPIILPNFLEMNEFLVILKLTKI